MPKPFTSENQPKNRKSGPNIKAKIIAALGRRNMTEDDFMDSLVALALDQGGVFMSELLKRYSPIPKQTHDPVVIQFPENGTPLQKADAIIKAMADGEISPDIGQIFMSAIKDSLGIEEVTELAKRLEALEKIINAKTS